MEVSEEEHGHQMPKLTVKQWKEKLFKELDLSGLESCPPELAEATQYLLANCHDVFSLETSELGCTHSTKHVIKFTHDTPFKEQFKQIPLPLVEAVHICEKCWIQVWFALARACGVMQWFWFGKKMEVYIFV